MARTRVITRTIIGTEYSVMTVNTVAGAVGTAKYTLTGEKFSDEKALKKLQKLYDTDTEKVVSIIGKQSVDCIFGMLETDFIKYAKRMDDERHFVDEEEELDADEEEELDTDEE